MGGTLSKMMRRSQSCADGIRLNSSSFLTWATKIIHKASGRSPAECYRVPGPSLGPRMVQVARCCGTWRHPTVSRHRLVGMACAMWSIGMGIPAVAEYLERGLLDHTMYFFLNVHGLRLDL